MAQEEIAAVLVDHGRWLRGEGGKRADLTGARLTHADLTGADLTHAVLRGAVLTGAVLRGAVLRGAVLTGAVLWGANLYGAVLTGADLTHAVLRGAVLTGAVLWGANLYGATIKRLLRRATRSDGYEFFLWHCEEGYYVRAGCHFFTLAEARQHWATRRAGTPLGDETQDILDFFAAAITRTEKEA